MPLRRNSLFRSQSISALHRQQLALWLVVERARVRPFFPAKFRTFQSATARTAQMRSPLNLKFQLAFAHIFSVSVFQDSSQFTRSGRTECIWRIGILWRHLRKLVYHVCDSRKERISFLWTPDDKRDISILANHSQRIPHRSDGIDEKHC